jgi:hypothetical protein
MDKNTLETLISQFQTGQLPLAELLKLLTADQTARLGHTELDLDRARRCGYPEVIFGASKTPAQLIDIAGRMLAAGHEVLITRVTDEHVAMLSSHHANLRHNATARTIRIAPPNFAERAKHGLVTILTAGTTDLPVAEEARETADWMGCQTQLFSDVGVAGPQRLLAHLPAIQPSDAVVVVAGMEGALPSVVGGYVACPVIGVPTSVGYGVSFGGLSALLTMLNSCVANVTVVNIDAGFKGGYLAGLIAQRAYKPES